MVIKLHLNESTATVDNTWVSEYTQSELTDILVDLVADAFEDSGNGTIYIVKSSDGEWYATEDLEPDDLVFTVIQVPSDWDLFSGLREYYNDTDIVDMYAEEYLEQHSQAHGYTVDDFIRFARRYYDNSTLSYSEIPMEAVEDYNDSYWKDFEPKLFKVFAEAYVADNMSDWMA